VTVRRDLDAVDKFPQELLDSFGVPVLNDAVNLEAEDSKLLRAGKPRCGCLEKPDQAA
jgi:hypothetical protein